MARRDANPLIGTWRITEMDLWDRDYLDEEGPAYITFAADGTGEFHFGLVHGVMDCRFELAPTKSTARFTWEGNDEMDDVMGRGWASVRSDGSMRGHIYFHGGDDSGFRATTPPREPVRARPRARAAPRRGAVSKSRRS